MFHHLQKLEKVKSSKHFHLKLRTRIISTSSIFQIPRGLQTILPGILGPRGFVMITHPVRTSVGCQRADTTCRNLVSFHQQSTILSAPSSDLMHVGTDDTIHEFSLHFNPVCSDQALLISTIYFVLDIETSIFSGWFLIKYRCWEDTQFYVLYIKRVESSYFPQ